MERMDKHTVVMDPMTRKIGRVFAKMAVGCWLVAGLLAGCAEPAETDSPRSDKTARVGTSATTETYSGTVTADQWMDYGPFNVAEGGTLTAQMTGMHDADLYVRMGAAPTYSEYDCRPYFASSDEECTVGGGGLVYVAVNGYAASSHFEIEVTYDAAISVGRPTVLLITGTLVPGELYSTMASRLEADGFNPVIYEPPDMFKESLITGAERIADLVDDLRAQTGEERIHIVAECNGGVATRYYLQLLGGDEHVDQVVTFVSAHHGTWTSPLGVWVTGWQSLEDVTPGSPFMQELNGAPFPEGLELTSIYTCWDEVMVPYTTSEVDGATNVEFCDHYIGHFDGFWDTVVYNRILATLQGQGDTAPTYY